MFEIFQIQISNLIIAFNCTTAPMKCLQFCINAGINIQFLHMYIYYLTCLSYICPSKTYTNLYIHPGNNRIYIDQRLYRIDSTVVVVPLLRYINKTACQLLSMSASKFPLILWYIYTAEYHTMCEYTLNDCKYIHIGWQTRRVPFSVPDSRDMCSYLNFPFVRNINSNTFAPIINILIQSVIFIDSLCGGRFIHVRARICDAISQHIPTYTFYLCRTKRATYTSILLYIHMCVAKVSVCIIFRIHFLNYILTPLSI